MTIVVLSDTELSPKDLLGSTKDLDTSELIIGGWRASKFPATSLWPHPHSAIWLGAYRTPRDYAVSDSGSFLVVLSVASEVKTGLQF